MNQTSEISRAGHADLRIGALLDIREKGPVRTIAHAKAHVDFLMRHGFESVAITFWERCGSVDPDALIDALGPSLEQGGAVLSALTLFGNPLKEGEAAEQARKDWKRLIEVAANAGCPLVSGFTGALTGRPVLDSVPALKKVFAPLCEQAGESGVKIAFENCKMGSSWNSAGSNLMYNPDGWEVVFEALPYDNLGLEWEPGHLVVQLSDPLANLRQWADRIFHVHGKDGRVCRDLLDRYGLLGKRRFCWQTTPGFGDSDWTAIISELRRFGYAGAIDIEGYHDPVYRGDLEMTGQLAALRYLKRCRGGEYTPNPNYEG